MGGGVTVDRSEEPLWTAMDRPERVAGSLPEVVALLGHEEPAVRVNAAWSIGYVVQAHPPTVRAVVGLLVPYLTEPAYRRGVARVLAYVAERFRAETRAAADVAEDDERAPVSPFLSRLADDPSEVDPHEVFVLDALAERRETPDDDRDPDDPAPLRRSADPFRDRPRGRDRRRGREPNDRGGDRRDGGPAEKRNDDPDAAGAGSATAADATAPGDPGGEFGGDDTSDATGPGGAGGSPGDDGEPLPRDRAAVSAVANAAPFEDLRLLAVVAAHDHAATYETLAHTGAAGGWSR